MLQHGKQEINIDITFIQESITIFTCIYLQLHQRDGISEFETEDSPPP